MEQNSKHALANTIDKSKLESTEMSFATAKKGHTSTGDDWENKSNNSNVSGNYGGYRSVSIAKPSFRSDIISENDNHKGMIEKQSPKFLKQW